MAAIAHWFSEVRRGWEEARQARRERIAMGRRLERAEAITSITALTTDEEILHMAKRLHKQHGYNTAHTVFYMQRMREARRG